MAGLTESAPELDDLHDDYPVDLDRVRDDIHLAQRAVITHQGEDWPEGSFCRNCREQAPCRLRRWGSAVLQAAGWGKADIVGLLARASTGDVPWTNP